MIRARLAGERSRRRARGRRRRPAARPGPAPRRRARPRLPGGHPRPARRDGRRPHARARARLRRCAACSPPGDRRPAGAAGGPADRRPGRRRADRHRPGDAGRRRPTDARPGDVLYGLKRGTEQTQLALAGDARGQTLLDFASTRLDEVRALVDEARPRCRPPGADGSAGTVLAAGADPALVIETLAHDGRPDRRGRRLADRAGGGHRGRRPAGRPGGLDRGRSPPGWPRSSDDCPPRRGRAPPAPSPCWPTSATRVTGLRLGRSTARPARPSTAPTRSARFPAPCAARRADPAAPGSGTGHVDPGSRRHRRARPRPVPPGHHDGPGCPCRRSRACPATGGRRPGSGAGGRVERADAGGLPTIPTPVPPSPTVPPSSRRCPDTRGRCPARPAGRSRPDRRPGRRRLPRPAPDRRLLTAGPRPNGLRRSR